MRWAKTEDALGDPSLPSAPLLARPASMLGAVAALLLNCSTSPPAVGGLARELVGPVSLVSCGLASRYTTAILGIAAVFCRLAVACGLHGESANGGEERQ